ncbi:AMP-binding protein [Kineosporia sp. J2-2]|uniref:AMP-binding protein n=1 Tax=Kineosporia corallincola TaxID=2835133 RepID=A0ABS5THQ5_9ACTN|nr:AMP-binding protein [Kineosporia corallincola]MBT0770622.1 AMP-binding protein [Kineosporia corallincola]
MLEHLQKATGGALHLYGGYDEDDPAEVIPYREFPARILAYAEHFRRQGVGPGTRVLFPFETSAPVVLAFLALMQAGALPLSVKPLLLASPKPEYEAFLRRVAQEHAADRVLLTPGLATVDLPVTALTLPSTPPGTGLDVEGAQLRTPADDEPAFVQFSSGSTAFPKGIPVLHGRLRANLAMIARTDGRRPGERVSSWLPLYHDMGLVGGLLSCLFTDVDLLLSDPLSFLADCPGWWEQMGREQAVGTVIPNFAVDYSLKLLQAAGPERLEGLDLSRVRSIYLGSEPIDIPHLRAFSDLMAPAGLRRDVFMPCYGMAETVLLVSSRPPGSEIRVVDGPSGVPAISLGPPMPEFSLRLRGSDGKLCGERELGEIELAGGTLADGYLGTGRPLAGPDGFYRTGDTGFVDDGELFVTGRISDRIKVNGQSLFAVDFEQAIERLPFVSPGRTAVIQSDGRIVVLTALRREARADPEGCRTRLVEHLVSTLGVTVRPLDVHYLSSSQLLRTSSGKLRRRELAEQYAAGEFGRVD